MARTKKLTFNWGGIRQRAERQVKTGLNLQILSRRTQRAVESQQLPSLTLTAARHYGHALTSVREFLRNPNQRGITRSGFRTIPLKGMLGNPVRVKTPQSWPALNQDYAARHKRSTTFWRKSGELSQLYQQVVLSILGQKPRVAVTSAVQRGRNLSMSARIGLGTLPDPLGHIIGVSFAQGRITSRPRVRGIQGEGPRHTILRISFPEAQRPVVSAIAARLGREMHAAIRKLD